MFTGPIQMLPLWVTSKLKEWKLGKFTPQSIRLAVLASDHRFTAPDIPGGIKNDMRECFVEVCRALDELFTSGKNIRKNPLCYPYAIQQLLTMHGLAHYCVYLKTIRCTTRRAAQVLLWKQIMDICGWSTPIEPGIMGD